MPWPLSGGARTLTSLARLVAGVAVSGALLVGGSGAPTPPAFAAVNLSPPQLLSVRMESPDTAYVTFRETNDVGPDVSSAGLDYFFRAEPHPGPAGARESAGVPAAGNGRVHTVTFSGLRSDVLYCFVGAAGVGASDLDTFWNTLWHGDRALGSGFSDEVCASMSSAGTDQSPLPCGVSGIKVANMVIREYDYTYYCNGSFRFAVTGLFDTRPVSASPADANRHLTTEIMKDGDTQIVANWICATDPWGVADTTSCTSRGDPIVQNPRSSFPATNGPLLLSVRFLTDSDRQELADGLGVALSSPTGTNEPQLARAGSTSPGGAAAPASGAALPQAPAAPASFTAAPENGVGPAVMLSWDAANGATFYYLTASSHDGGDPVALGHGAPKLDGGTTSFRVDGSDNAANIEGGVDFKLQACNLGGCAAMLTTTYP